MFLSVYAGACETIFKFYEQKYKIPSNILQAIARVESARLYKNKLEIWPWTVQSQGRSYYLSSKERAVKIVEQLLNQGIDDIDVGCMQVNLKYHPNAFKDLSSAFEPTQNIAYAARYLKSLYDSYKSWSKAIAYYHSRNPYKNQAYLKKVNQFRNILSTDIKASSTQGLVRFISYKSDTIENSHEIEETPPKRFLQPTLKVRNYRYVLG